MDTVVGIEQLFDHDRFPTGVQLFLFVLYFPFGVLLALVRCFIGLHAFLLACLLPKPSLLRSLILRPMCIVLGIVVFKEGGENRNRKAKVLCANYTNTLDHLAVDLIVQHVMPCVWDLPNALMRLLGYSDMGAKLGRDVLIENVKTHCQGKSIPVLTFPEGASTNGRVGLLKFSVWPFSLDQPVQPLLIQTKRPIFTKLPPSILGGRWWMDIVWFLIVPITCFYIRILPVMEKRDDETVDDFTRRTQLHMASVLNIQATKYTSADKVEYAKKKLFLPPASLPRNATARSLWTEDEDSELNVMARQVREVLPHVPMSAIKRDLDLTKDVDLTITNILEGRVQYASGEEERNTSLSSRIASNSKPSAKSSSGSLKQFGKTSKERHLTFEEKKKQLLELARRRYKEKHDML